jgi:hypothetical protein
MNDCYIKETDFVTRNIGGETIIVPIRSHVGDLDSIYILNGIGTRVWELIDGLKDAKEIAETICSEYEVSMEEAERDITEFMRELRELGAIREV